MLEPQVRQPGFGARLRRLRRERGMSQRELAGDSMTSSYVSLLEGGVRVPRPDMLDHLARTLGVSVHDLIAEPAEPEPASPGTASPSTGTAHHTSTAGPEIYHRTVAESYAAACRDGDPQQILSCGRALQRELVQADERHEALSVLTHLEPVAAKIESVEWQIVIGTEYAMVARDLGRLETALVHAATAERLLSRSTLEGTAEHVKLCAVQLSVRAEMGLCEDVEAKVDEMIALAAKVADPQITGRAYWAACLAYSRCGMPDKAASHVLQAHSMLATPETSLGDWARFLRAAATTLMEDPARLDEAGSLLDEAQRIAAVLPGEDAKLDGARAQFAQLSGDPRLAVELGLKARDRLQGVASVRAHVTLGRAYFALGEMEAGAASLRTAAELAGSMGSHILASKIWQELAER
ncbi:MAG: hypothetical protein QG671_1490 [Actinomycetota bacterium]|nr:hypothetical protein [Actinomycetota bacterium]